jgi:hypothetical protein
VSGVSWISSRRIDLAGHQGRGHALIGKPGSGAARHGDSGQLQQVEADWREDFQRLQAFRPRLEAPGCPRGEVQDGVHGERELFAAGVTGPRPLADDGDDLFVELLRGVLGALLHLERDQQRALAPGERRSHPGRYGGLGEHALRPDLARLHPQWHIGLWDGSHAHGDVVLLRQTGVGLVPRCAASILRGAGRENHTGCWNQNKLSTTHRVNVPLTNYRLAGGRACHTEPKTHFRSKLAPRWASGRCAAGDGAEIEPGLRDRCPDDFDPVEVARSDSQFLGQLQ